MLNLRNTRPLRRTLLTSVRQYTTDNFGPQPTNSNGDNFLRRERASEDWYIRQHEKEQLKNLQEEIQKREKELHELKEKASKLKN